MLPLDEDARKLIYKEYKKRMMMHRLTAGVLGLTIGWLIKLLWDVV